jgi:hypothetical protein
MPKPAPVLEWHVHLARRHPRRAIIVAVAVLAVAAICYAAFRQPVFALVSGVLVALSTADFLVPIRYRVTEGGIEMRCGLSLRRMTWSQVRSCYRDESGLKLSPLPAPSRLEAFRGIYLWFGDDNAEAIVREVGSRRPVAAESTA